MCFFIYYTIVHTNYVVWGGAPAQPYGLQFLPNYNILFHNYLFSLQPDGCDLSKFFISFNLILVVGASAISILPSVQEHQPRSGLLQSAVVSLYVMYLTWSALSNSAGECNASISGTNQVRYKYINLSFKDKIIMPIYVKYFKKIIEVYCFRNYQLILAIHIKKPINIIYNME